MIADFENDIYFQPSVLLEILEDEIKIKASNEKNIRMRKLIEHRHLITKYDAYEMNKKF